jgi:hypothetical protein
MTNQDSTGPVKDLPDVIRRYLDAHDRHDTDRALSAFASDARVIDEDREHRGTDEIRAWLASSASEYTYTRTLVGIKPTEGDRWVVVNRLEGDFPGGVAVLRYQFGIQAGLISELVIAP